MKVDVSITSLLCLFIEVTELVFRLVILLSQWIFDSGQLFATQRIVAFCPCFIVTVPSGVEPL